MPSSVAWPIILRTIGLLFVSNVFMTIAWYGHLKFKDTALWVAILASWLIALPEYAVQVPANRMGYGAMTAYQLKIVQEVITLVVFSLFAWFALGEAPRWNHLGAFVLLLGAVALAFYK